MGQKRDLKEEQLVQDLYARLNWFTFEATDEEFDTKQIQAILDLLDMLDPAEAGPESGERMERLANCFKRQEKNSFFGEPKSAFQRFQLKYHISDEELAEKNG